MLAFLYVIQDSSEIMILRKSLPYPRRNLSWKLFSYIFGDFLQLKNIPVFDFGYERIFKNRKFNTFRGKLVDVYFLL